jgi:hypothetical protein
VTEYCEHGNEPSVFIKSGEFYEHFGECHLLRNDFAPWSLLGFGVD